MFKIIDNAKDIRIAVVVFDDEDGREPPKITNLTQRDCERLGLCDIKGVRCYNADSFIKVAE